MCPPKFHRVLCLRTVNGFLPKNNSVQGQDILLADQKGPGPDRAVKGIHCASIVKSESTVIFGNLFQRLAWTDMQSDFMPKAWELSVSA